MNVANRQLYTSVHCCIYFSSLLYTLQFFVVYTSVLCFPSVNSLFFAAMFSNIFTNTISLSLLQVEGWMPKVSDMLLYQLPLRTRLLSLLKVVWKQIYLEYIYNVLYFKCLDTFYVLSSAVLMEIVWVNVSATASFNKIIVDSSCQDLYKHRFEKMLFIFKHAALKWVSISVSLRLSWHGNSHNCGG